MGWPGRIAAVLVVDPDGLFCARHSSEPQQASRDDALRHIGTDGHVAVLHGDAPVCGESFPARRNSDARWRDQSVPSQRWSGIEPVAAGPVSYTHLTLPTSDL